MNVEASITLCEICPSKNKACCICRDCNQCLCQLCLTYHQKFNGTCSHTVCLIFTSQSSGNETECPIHNKKLEFHCNDDGKNGCEDCKESCHHMCQNVKHFSSFIEEKDELLHNCNQMIEQVTQKKMEAVQCNKLLKRNTENWIKRMNDKLEQMKAAMTDLDNKVKQKEANLQELLKRRQHETDTQQQAYADTMQELNSKMCSLKTASLRNSEIEIVKAIQELQETLDKQDSNLRKDPCEGHTVAFLKEEHRFEAKHYVSKTLEQMMETASSINEIYVEIQRNSLQTQTTPAANDEETAVKRRHSSSECSDCKTQPSRVRTLSEREKIEQYQSLVQVKETDSVPEIPVESMEDILIKQSDDKEKCAITGIAELSGGIIIMADFNNFKLKLMNASGLFIDSKKTDSEPRDIAVIDGSKVIVSIPKAQCILFVDIYVDNETNTHKMRLGTTYKVEGKCCGIAFHDNKIYTATQMPTQILILNIDGERLHSISGEGLFERPTYTTVAPDGSLIYMSDPNHKYVYGLTRNGEILFKYKVDGPHGIATTEKGELLIADFDTSSVHLVSKDGVKMAALAPENCHCPQKVFYSQQTRLLLVTMWNSDRLFKFKLQ